MFGICVNTKTNTETQTEIELQKSIYLCYQPKLSSAGAHIKLTALAFFSICLNAMLSMICVRCEWWSGEYGSGRTTDYSSLGGSLECSNVCHCIECSWFKCLISQVARVTSLFFLLCLGIPLTDPWNWFLFTVCRDVWWMSYDMKKNPMWAMQINMNDFRKWNTNIGYR